MYDGVSFTSMVGAAIDEATGYIYLIYAMPIEYTDYFGDPEVSEAQSFRDLLECILLIMEQHGRHQLI